MVDSKPIYVALAQRKDVRKAQLEQQYNSPRMAPPLPGPPGRGAPLPGMFPQQFQPQFYAGPGPMAPPGGRPNGPGMGAMYPQMVGPRGMVSHVPRAGGLCRARVCCFTKNSVFACSLAAVPDILALGVNA